MQVYGNVSKVATSACIPSCPNNVGHIARHGKRRASRRAKEPPILKKASIGRQLEGYEVSENNATPQIIHFNRVFHSKPSIFGVFPYSWKHLYRLWLPSSNFKPSHGEWLHLMAETGSWPSSSWLYDDIQQQRDPPNWIAKLLQLSPFLNWREHAKTAQVSGLLIASLSITLYPWLVINRCTSSSSWGWCDSK